MRHANLNLSGVDFYPNVDRDSFVGDPLRLDQGGTGSNTFKAASVVVVNTEGTALESSEIPAEKLKFLNTLTENVQDQIDSRIKTITINGQAYESIDGNVDLSDFTATKTKGTLTFNIGDSTQEFNGSEDIAIDLANIDALSKNGDTTGGTYVFTNNNRATGTTDNNPALIVGGNKTEQHLELDGEGIMSKENDTTPADLYLNRDGGNVHVGGDLMVDEGRIVMGKKCSMSYDNNRNILKLQFV